MDKKGHADLIFEIITKFELKKPVLYGYDWGGAIILRLASHKPYNNYSKLIAFMPYYDY